MLNNRSMGGSIGIINRFLAILPKRLSNITPLASIYSCWLGLIYLLISFLYSIIKTTEQMT